MAKQRTKKTAVASPAAGLTATIQQLLIAVGNLKHPGLLTKAMRTRGMGPLLMPLVRLVRDVRREIASYAEAVDQLAENCGATRLASPDGSVTYEFSKRDTPSQAEQKKIDSFNEQHTELCLSSVTLSHVKMPELIKLLELTGDEAESLAWLVVVDSEEEGEKNV